MKTASAILLVLVLLSVGCIGEKETAPETTAIATSTSGTEPATTTTTTLPDTALDTCTKENDTIKRDNCYLLLAMNTNNGSICRLIERASARGLCNENTQIETDGTSTTLQGYVINKTTSHAMPNVRVTAVSKTYGTVIGEDTTNEEGYYSMDVPSRDTYNLTIEVGGKTYSDEVYARFSWTHEIWMRV
jgi:hypothetical protein